MSSAKRLTLQKFQTRDVLFSNPKRVSRINRPNLFILKRKTRGKAIKLNPLSVFIPVFS